MWPPVLPCWLGFYWHKKNAVEKVHEKIIFTGAFFTLNC
jgi:hypothetical protein